MGEGGRLEGGSDGGKKEEGVRDGGKEEEGEGERWWKKERGKLLVRERGRRW